MKAADESGLHPRHREGPAKAGGDGRRELGEALQEHSLPLELRVRDLSGPADEGRKRPAQGNAVDAVRLSQTDSARGECLLQERFVVEEERLGEEVPGGSLGDPQDGLHEVHEAGLAEFEHQSRGVKITEKASLEGPQRPVLLLDFQKPCNRLGDGGIGIVAPGQLLERRNRSLNGGQRLPNAIERAGIPWGSWFRPPARRPIRRLRAALRPGRTLQTQCRP
jgi:hypothetical protein